MAKLPILKRKPLSEEVTQLLTREIRSGAFPNGKFPSENELALKLGISRMTVRNAMEPLVAEGILTRVRGKGTFLNSPWKEAKRATKALQLGVLTWSRFVSSEAPTSNRGFYSAIMHGMIDRAAKDHYALTFQPAESLRDISNISDLCRSGALSGLLLLALAEEGPLKDLLAKHLPENFPVVLVDHRTEHVPIDCVEIDNVQGAKTAISHLFELGHRKIGFVNWQFMEYNTYRLQGFREGMKKVGLDVNPDWIVSTLAHQSGSPAVRKLLSGKERPTAILTFNSCMALSVGEEAERCGLKVSEDLSVIGFGSHADKPYPSGISLIHIQPEKIGIAGVERLLDRIANPYLEPKHILVRPKLLEAESTGPAPQG